MRRLWRAVREVAPGIPFWGPRLVRDPSLAPPFLRCTLGLPFDRPPVIIGGCGRSGTSVVLSLLSALSSVLAVPYATHAFAPTLYTDEPDPGAPFEVWRLYWALTRIGVPDRSRRWCEKTAKNVVMFGRLRSYFDGAVRLIHVVRDGRDVVTSRHTVNSNEYWVEPERWVRDVSAGLEHASAGCVHTLRYEDLVVSTSETLRRLGAFLDEDLAGLEDHWVDRAQVQTFGPFDRRVARPLERSSIGRWRQEEYADRVEQFLETPGARELLDELGYPI